MTLGMGFIPILIFSLKSNKSRSSNNYFLPFIILTAIASIYELVFTSFLKIISSHWFQIYDFLEFFALVYFFMKIFEQKQKDILFLFAFIFLISFGISIYFWEVDNSLVSKGINSITTTLLVFTAIFIWFKNEFQKLEIAIIWQNAKFYFISGFLIYYASTIFLFIASNFIFKNENLKFEDYWFLNIIATFILRTFLIIGTWKELQK